MANMNEEEMKMIEGFFIDQSVSETSIKPQSPPEVSLNLTVTSRQGHRRKKQQSEEHVRHPNRIVRNSKEIVTNELQKFNAFIKGVSGKWSQIENMLDKMDKPKNQQNQHLRSQAYQEMSLLKMEVKKHYRQQHSGPSKLSYDKLKQQVMMLTSTIKEKDAEIENLKSIIDRISEDVQEKQNIIQALQNGIAQKQNRYRTQRQKHIQQESKSTVEDMLLKIEQNLEVINLNDKIQQLNQEIEKANLEKSSLFNRTKCLEDKLSKYAQSCNKTRFTSNTKNTTFDSMQQYSFSLDPSENDISEWINAFSQYHDHAHKKCKIWMMDFKEREGRKPTDKQKQQAQIAEWFVYRQHFNNILQDLRTIRATKDTNKREDKSPSKEIAVNLHRGSTNILHGLNEKPKEIKNLQNQIELLKKSLESCKKDRMRLENQNQNLLQSLKAMQEQLMMQMKPNREDSVSMLDQDSRLRQCQLKIQQLNRTVHEYRLKLKTVMKKKSDLQGKYQSLLVDMKDMQYRLENEFLDRRKLHNQVEDLKGKIRVYCRIRPMIKTELDKKCQKVVISNMDSLTVISGQRTKTYKYDAIFGEESSQEDVFEETKKMVQSAYDGYNVCIFAYGQTGSGKTYTIHGSETNPGLSLQSIEQLYRLIELHKNREKTTVSVQMVQIYLDNVYDMYSKDRKPLEIGENTLTKEIQIRNSFLIKVTDQSQMVSTYKDGLKSRKTSSTNMNSESSRSHLLFMINIQVQTKGHNNNIQRRRGRLNIIDLAGSEKQNKAGSKENTLKEGNAINSSLTCLGRVLLSLNEKKTHIPFRQNKLTYLLRDSLTGNSKTLMFVNISPADANIQETITSLHFANSVKSIERMPLHERVNSEEDQRKSLPKNLKA